MKSFLKGILTIWITILFLALGIVLSIKGILIDTADNVIKQEITTNVVDVIEDYTHDSISPEVIKEVKENIENNKEIKKVIDKYFTKIVDVLSSDGSNINIDVASELNSIIDSGEKILKDYGINITEEERKELLSIVSSSEVNDMVNEMVVEVKGNMSDDVKMVFEIYNFLTSTTFKLIIITLIAVSLLLIALLKKSLYLWLSNLAIATIISGTIIGIILPLLIDNILKTLANDIGFTITTSSLNTYGYIFIAIGVISIIVKILISIILKNKAKNNVLKNDSVSEKTNSINENENPSNNENNNNI